MPITYDIEQSTRLVIATGSGKLSGKDVLEHIRDLANDERYIPPMKKIIDYRAVEDLVISMDEAEMIATRKGRLDEFKGEVCAFITPGDSTYGTARVHQAMLGKGNVKSAVFRSKEEALGWIMEQKLY